MEQIGTRIRRLRVERGLAQRDIAGPGVSAAYLSLIERGVRTPSVKALRVLARNLGVTPEYLETGQAISERDLRSMRLLETEIRLRLSENPAEVEDEFRELHWSAVEAGDSSGATRALIGLGLAASHRGAHREAALRLERAVRDPWVTPAAHPMIFVTLARAYSETGSPQKAVALLEDALEEVRTLSPEDTSTAIRFTTYLTFALQDAGDPERAQVLLDAIQEIPDTFQDPRCHVRYLWSQARLASDRGEAAAAIAGMQKAIGLIEASENDLSLGKANLLCAEILLSDDRIDEARTYLERAERLLGANAETQDRAVLLAEKAKLAARTGDGPLSVGLAHRALEILGDRDPPEQGRAYWALGEGLAACGRRADAERAFDQAYELLRREARYVDRLARARARVLGGTPAKSRQGHSSCANVGLSPATGKPQRTDP